MLKSFLRAIILFAFIAVCLLSEAQSCDEILNWVKNRSEGSTYTSISSDAISSVTFHEVENDNQTSYFAIVCFKNQNNRSKEYIYQVSSTTETKYSMYYSASAGKAFWNYIRPHRDSLGCSP